MKKMGFVLCWMQFLFLGLLFSLFFAGSLSAQMSLVSSFPVDGAVSVDTTATLILTFNQPIDVSANFEGLDLEDGFFLGLSLYPLGKYLEPDSLTFSSDFKTVYFHNMHLWPDTKYVFLLLGAKSACGDSLDKPCVINFSTGNTLPTNTVSGTVSYAGDPTNTIVTLLGLEMGGSGPDFLASTVVSSPSGYYTISYVDTGEYVGAAILDANHNGNLDIETDPLGWYDSDFNSVPDTIKVTGNITGVNIIMGTVTPNTAKGLFDIVDDMVKTAVSDAKLIFVVGYELDLDGKSVQWSYVYFNKSTNKLYIVSTLGASILPMTEEDTQFQIDDSISVNWIDSDSALTIAEASGGSDFRNSYPNTKISAALFPASEAGMFSGDKAGYSWEKLCWKLTPKSIMKRESFLQDQIIWRIEYNSDAAGKDTTIYLDAVTGDLVTDVESEELDTSIPSSYELRQNYPNPFNPTTTIAYNLLTESQVVLNVYDLSGREVRRLIDETKRAGSYKVEWDGKDRFGRAAASGIYIYRIVTKSMDNRKQSYVNVKKMIFMK